MFQSFDVKGGPKVGRRNLPKLRAALAKAGLDGFLIPHEDEYQNEYLPEANERLAWATGFTGSAGAALILADVAVLFVDGRYTVQGGAQTDETLFEVCDLVSEGPAKWIAANASEGLRIGYDPKLHSPASVRPLAEAAAKAGAVLVAVTENPVDIAWKDRPAQPLAEIVVHPDTFAGEPHAEKRERLSGSLAQQGLDAAVLTAPASLAWLFNIRGGDVAHTPLPLGAAILRKDASAALFVHPDKVTAAVRAHLGNQISIRPESEFAQGLAALSDQRVLVDPAQSSAWVFSALGDANATVHRGEDPCSLPRACKNAVELEGAREAHRRDGAVLTMFLHWLATEGQSGTMDEIVAATKLEELRRTLPELRDLSFESISAAGPNSALPHYRVSTASNRKLKRGSLYLIDSGGQYPDGTTDVTRTVAIGRPKPEMRDRYTLVLKGHIALSVIRFPEGTAGAHLDALARAALWNAGLDYDHGTGHGVGSYLGVHEGPQRIARALSPTPLMPGMIVSNEPGYYKPGGYGIRIENLQAVAPPSEIEGGDRKMLGFETLTLAPLERGLIQKRLLTKDERDWVNRYHARVWDEIGPRVGGEAKTWLEAQCAPL